MAGMQIRPISEFSAAPAIPEVRSASVSSPEVDPGIKLPEKEAKRPEELSNVVSRSGDGDTVQVSRASADKLSEDAFGRMDVIGRDERTGNTDGAVLQEQDPTDPEVFGRNADEKVIPNMNPAPASSALEKAKDDEEEEKEEEAVKSVETDDAAKITSFAGYTEDQLRQMYQKGEISKRDYDRQMELKEALKGSNEDAEGKMSEMVKGVLGLESAGRIDETELKNAFSDKASDTTDAMQRVAVLDAMEKNMLGL
ncbi:MAG TPA: hypothetical protein DCL38_10275 [Lachnospiraceae bacterium]|nr:hypothetical protein [Lachnospiraceae bacterium]